MLHSMAGSIPDPVPKFEDLGQLQETAARLRRDALPGAQGSKCA